MIKDFGYIRVATASPKLRVADLDYNYEQIISQIEIASNKNVSLILFPELSLTSYSCGDLFYQRVLHKKSLEILTKLAEISAEKLVSIVVGLPIFSSGKLFNSACLISNGELAGIVPKTYLCNTSEYYEERWFSSEFDRVVDSLIINGEEVPFGADLIFKDNNSEAVFGIEICEDLWAINQPSNDLALAGCNVILNLSASNEYLGKKEYRKDLVRMQSAKLFAAYLYSASGSSESTTDTVFSGHSLIYENGICLAEANRFSFESELIIADIDIDKLNNDRISNNSFGGSSSSKDFRQIEISLSHKSDTLLQKYSKTPFIPNNKEKLNETASEILEIQSTALAKRISHIGIKSVTIGISGGLDSTLALLVTQRAFDKLGLERKGIIAISMPGFGTSDRTYNNAKTLIDEIGATFLEIKINESVLQHFKDIGHNPELTDITYENSQARERTQILMDVANQRNGIVIGTGDLSELALGWCTYNADQMSMYNVNSGVPKTLVKYIIEFVSHTTENTTLRNTLLDIIDTPISPELLPTDKDGKIDQFTETSVGPYILNDFFLYHFLRNKFSPEKILFLTIETYKNDYPENEIKERLISFFKRFFSQQFKRSAMPDGPKIGTVSLSPRADWRMPSDASFNSFLEKLV